MVLAVLQRRGAGPARTTDDVFAATVGGVRVTEPAADLALALAVASAARDRADRRRDLVAIGEVGLAGEVRRVGGVRPAAGRGGPARLHRAPWCRPAPGPLPAGMRVTEVGRSGRGAARRCRD